MQKKKSLLKWTPKQKMGSWTTDLHMSGSMGKSSNAPLVLLSGSNSAKKTRLGSAKKTRLGDTPAWEASRRHVLKACPRHS